MVEIICALVAGISSIVVAVIGISVKKSNAKVQESNEKMEQRAKLRQQESLLSLKMMDATLQLSIVCSNALTGGHNNGNVERARKAAEEAAAKYEDFVRETAVHELYQ